jgi:hypothetical protein
LSIHDPRTSQTASIRQDIPDFFEDVWPEFPSCRGILPRHRECPVAELDALFRTDAPPHRDGRLTEQ